MRKQVAFSKVHPIEGYQDDYGSLAFDVHGGPKAPVVQRVPIEGKALDKDGVPIEFLLPVVDGMLKELEVVKADGSPIVRRPKASDLKVPGH